MNELITDEMVAEMTGHQVLEPGAGFGGAVEWDCECGITVHDGAQADAWEPFARHQMEMLAPLIAGRALRNLAAKKRADWAPDPCPWVGALDDEADRIERSGA